MGKKKEKKMKPQSFRPFMRETQQLVIEPSYAMQEKENPLSAAHEKFSRFNICVIEDGKPSTMSMRWFSDTPEVANSYIEFRERAKIAKEMHVSKTIKASSMSENSSPAFTLLFKSGKYTQGKTCAQVLKEYSNGRELLTQQKDFLEKNVAKYSGNQVYIDAINEALSLTQEQLSSVEQSVVILLYASGLRINTYRKNKNGKSFCYDGKIEFYPGMDYPTKISIANMYSDVKEEKGLTTIVKNTSEDLTTGSISLSFGETLRLLEELDVYYSIKMRELTEQGIDIAEKMAEEIRFEAKEKSSFDPTSVSDAFVDDDTQEVSNKNTKQEELAEEDMLKSAVVYSWTKPVKNQNGFIVGVSSKGMDETIDGEKPKLYNLFLGQDFRNSVGDKKYRDILKTIEENIEQDTSVSFPVTYKLHSVKNETGEIANYVLIAQTLGLQAS